MLAYSFQEKIYPTRFYLRAFYRQAASNFAYSFIKFEEKIPTYSFISAYSIIRQLRVHNNMFQISIRTTNRSSHELLLEAVVHA